MTTTVASRVDAFLRELAAAGTEREAAVAKRLADDPSPDVAALIVEVYRRYARVHPVEGWRPNEGAELRAKRALEHAVTALARRKLPIGPRDAAVLVDLVPGKLTGWSAPALALPVTALTACLASDAGDDVARAAAQRLLARVDGLGTDTYDRTAWLVRLRGLLSGDLGLDDAIDLVFDGGDAWGAALRAGLRERFRDAAGVPELLGFAARKIPSKVPAAKWRKACATVLAGCSAAGDVLRTTLGALPSTPNTPYETSYGTFAYFLTPPNSESAKTLLWMTVELRPPWAAKLFADLAMHCSPGPLDQKVANAAVLALGELGDRAAVGQLARARLRIRNRNTRKQMEEALASAAAKAGVPATELLELCVPDLGLGADGRRVGALGEASAALVVEADASARIVWLDAQGREQKSAPAAVRAAHAEELAALNADLRELRGTLTTERARLEDLIASERVWTFAEWDERYRRHPVTRVVARRLLWRVALAGGELRPGLPDAAGDAFTDCAGLRFVADASGTVRPWHPIASSSGEVEAWRQRLLREELVQPFKQAFREVYALTPAEEATEVYSNRFAGHILRYRQASALMKVRRWDANALGEWDGGSEGLAWKDFPDHGLRAELDHDLVLPEDGSEGDGLATHCVTDQVRFRRRATGEAVALASVPAVVFSEAMRDVDLFVGVTSIAADPNWSDSGVERRLRDYWSAHAFGVLTEIGRVRREALLRIVPRLRIADRCRLEERFLVVRGDLATYHVHLGSGNVRIEPGSRYLCIVADQGASRASLSKVFLPFDDDPVLSVVLSKALLLANDRKIEDETILRQIRSRV